MNQDGHHLSAFRIQDTILLRSSTTNGYRIDEFKVAGIEAEGKVNIFARASGPVGAVTHVIQHVTPAPVLLGIGIVKAPEDILSPSP